MFWKNTAWSWDDTAGNDDDDGGYLLAADLRRTPDSAPDTDLTRITTNTTTTTTAATTNLSNCTTTTTGLKDLTNHSLTSSRAHSLDPTNANANYSSGPANANYSNYVSTLYANTNQRQVTRNSGSTQRLTVS